MSNLVYWDQKLIDKYNVAGPRYTSYPTALSFQDGFTQAQVLKAIENSSSRELSLYIHVPFCHQLCYYCGCNKVITRHQDKADVYIDFLITEMQAQSANFSQYQVSQLHFGGGTPTFLNDKQMHRLMGAIKQHFNFTQDAEISIEVDPRSVTLETISFLHTLGFNRLSVGIQDFEQKVQQAVNREQDELHIRGIFAHARQLGFKSINADFIYGLPYQTPESFAQSVEKLIALSPDRVSVFNYAHLPERFPAQRKIKDETLPSAQAKLTMFKQTIEAMLQADYVYIGIDHFAKKQDSLAIAQQAGKLHRNFQGYTTHGNCDLLGLGASSISQVGNAIFQNPKDLKPYYQAVEANGCPVVKGVSLNDDDEIRGTVIRELLCHFSVDKKSIEQQFDISFDQYFEQSLANLAPMMADKLVTDSGDAIQIEQKGRLFARNIVMAFDAYLTQQAKLNRFSRVL